MSPLWDLILVWLICGFSTAIESAAGGKAASKKHSNYRKTCMGLDYDIREAVCCENQLHQGAGLSCCGKLPFNPSAATCCKTGCGPTLTGTVTWGLSEKVSACCGLKAYNPLNEICCNSTIIAIPVPNAQCCGKEAFDKNTQLCCGPPGNKTVLIKKSSHHQCCGTDQYDTTTQCCCQIADVLQIQRKDSDTSCCANFVEVNATNTVSESAELSAKEQTCDEKAFDKNTQLCCGPPGNKTVLMKKSSHHQCCGTDQYDTTSQCCCQIADVLQIQRKDSDTSCCAKAFDKNMQLCCGPPGNKTVLMKKSSHHQCCGTDQYDTTTQCCCQIADVLQIQRKDSDTSCCANFVEVNATNTVSESAELSAKEQKCDEKAFDKNTQLCCGPPGNKTVLMKKSSHHQCCDTDQYDTTTQCCCQIADVLQIQRKDSDTSCCANFVEVNATNTVSESAELSAKEQKCDDILIYIDASVGLQVTSGINIVAVRVSRESHICVVAQCCGETLYGLAQHGVLCCNNTLYTGREDGQACEISIPYNPAKGTICCSQFHGSPGQRCCGTELFRPRTEICCRGHRHPKVENVHCYGVKAYDIKDPHMKCCSGALYNLTSLGKEGHDMQCCGSILQTPQEVCCSNKHWKLLYSAKTGFRCCGHMYYNTSLWSCCAGNLSPVSQPGHHQGETIKKSRFLSVRNLNETDLCKGMHVGIVESVSLHSIVFNSVLKIHGRNATVMALSSPYILKIPHCCSSPKLIPGKTYFFNEVNVFTDFNHQSLQSLNFIFSKCYHP